MTIKERIKDCNKYIKHLKYEIKEGQHIKELKERKYLDHQLVTTIAKKEAYESLQKELEALRDSKENRREEMRNLKEPVGFSGYRFFNREERLEWATLCTEIDLLEDPIGVGGE